MIPKYKRIGGRGFVVYEMELPEPGEELQMILHNRISWLLPLELQGVDGQWQLHYCIDGKCAMADVFQKKKINGELLDAILHGIWNMLKGAREYLLCPDDVVFTWECLYWDMEKRKIYTGYLPGYNQSVSSQLKVLFEEMLPLMDVKDKQGQERMYNLYEEWCCQGGSLDILERYVKHEEDIQIAFLESHGVVAPYGNPPKEKLTNAHSITIPDVALVADGTDSPYYEENRMIVWLRGFWNRIRGRDDIPTVPLPAEVGAQSWEQEFGGAPQREIKQGGVQVWQQEQSSTQVGQQASKGIQGLQQEPENNATTLLSVIQQLPQLKCMDGNHSNIVPGEEKQLIGRLKAACDYVLPVQEVSRVHASVQLKEGELVIADLNSVNGTFLNHEQIPIKENVVVKKGDIVTFGTVSFMVI